jgi:hypothetical protein
MVLSGYTYDNVLDVVQKPYVPNVVRRNKRGRLPRFDFVPAFEWALEFDASLVLLVKSGGVEYQHAAERK